MAFVATAVGIAAVVGTGAAVYGMVNQYEAAQEREAAAETQVAGARVNAEATRVAVQAAEMRVTGAGYNVLGTEIQRSAAEQRRIAAEFSGEVSARGYEFEASVAHRNAITRLQDADYTRYVGELLAQKEGLETRFKRGTARVIQAASGLDVNFGSAVQVRDSISAIGRWNQDTVRANAGRAAFGLDRDAAQFLAQEQIDLQSAVNARITGQIVARGAEYEIAAADLARQGAILGVQGAQLGVEGARLGVSAADLGITGAQYGANAAGYEGSTAIASGLGTVASRWMDASRVGLGTSGSSSGQVGSTIGDYYDNTMDVS